MRAYIQTSERVRKALGLVSVKTGIYRMEILEKMLEDKGLYDRLVEAAKELKKEGHAPAEAK